MVGQSIWRISSPPTPFCMWRCFNLFPRGQSLHSRRTCNSFFKADCFPISRRIILRLLIPQLSSITLSCGCFSPYWVMYNLSLFHYKIIISEILLSSLSFFRNTGPSPRSGSGSGRKFFRQYTKEQPQKLHGGFDMRN